VGRTSNSHLPELLVTQPNCSEGAGGTGIFARLSPSRHKTLLDHKCTVLAGMKRERANRHEIEGKQALFVVNLPPRKNGANGFARHALRHRLFV